MDDEAELLPLPEAAHLLGLSWGQTWRLLLRGVLTGRKRGRHWLVSEESVKRLANKRRDSDEVEEPR